jgi:hypothetical protein
MTDTDLSPMQEQDFDDEFGGPPAARRVPPLTALLAVGVALALAFTSGVLTQKHHDASASSASARSAPTGGFAPGGLGRGGNQAAAGGGTAGGGSTAAGPAVIGTLVKTDGKTATVQDLGGKQHLVHLTASTTATRTTTLALTALKPGATVTVTGTANADGSIGATAITVR